MKNEEERFEVVREEERNSDRQMKMKDIRDICLDHFLSDLYAFDCYSV